LLTLASELRVLPRHLLVPSPPRVTLHVDRGRPVVDPVAVVVLRRVVAEVVDRPRLDAVVVADQPVERVVERRGHRGRRREGRRARALDLPRTAQLASEQVPRFAKRDATRSVP
jgi:hypothetical protein